MVKKILTCPTLKVILEPARYRVTSNTTYTHVGMKPSTHRLKQHPRFLRLLITLTLIFFLHLTCLDLSATITRSVSIPTYRGKLTDNNKFVCGINLPITFGSRLPWNCLPGFQAWSTPDGSQLTYTRDGHKFVINNIKKSWQGDPVTHGNQMTILRAKNFGCRLVGPWTPVPKRSEFWERRMNRE